MRHFSYTPVTAEQFNAYASLLEIEANRLRTLTASMTEKGFESLEIQRVASLTHALEEIPKSINAAFESLSLQVAGITPRLKQRPGTETDTEAERVAKVAQATRKKRRKKR